MKTKNVFKILLDIAMTVLFVILTFGFGTSMFFHEVAGIGIFVLFLVHILLNIQLIKGLFKTSARGKKKAKAIILIIADVILTIGVIMILVTGVLISQVLFSLGLVHDTTVSSGMHHIASYVCLGVISFHVLLHIKYLLLSCKTIVKNITSGGVKKASLGFVTLCVMALMLYSQFQSYFDKPIDIVPIEPQKKVYASAPEEPVADEQSVESAPEEPADDEYSVESAPEDSASDAVEIEPEPAEPTPSLDEYLGSLFCSACGKHCSLLSPHCGRGMQQAEEATAQYEATYGA